jgi:hypothetical protein
MSEVPPDQRPQQGGVAALLALGLAAALGGCGFAWYHVGGSLKAAESLGMEISALAQFYAGAVIGAFAVPVVTWLVAMAVTRAGRGRRSLGLLLAALLFGFAVLWPAGAVAAFLPVFDRPLNHVRGE